MKVSGRRAFLPSYQLANVKSVPTRRSLDRCDGARRSRLPLDVGLARRAIVASGRLAIGKEKPRRSEAQDLRVGGGHPPWCLTGTGSCGARIKRLLAPQFGDAIELTSEMQAGERGTTTEDAEMPSAHQRVRHEVEPPAQIAILRDRHCARVPKARLRRPRLHAVNLGRVERQRVEAGIGPAAAGDM
jgi:hypothetical protein